ncbi:MAG: response regulator [Frankiales bacterium]|nr:response regulator [Frankiales bacterium]
MSVPAPPGDHVARLERQAARERTARLEAEQIAENQLRRAFERSREVELLAAIAVIVNESGDALTALGSASRVLRRHCDFAVAHVLVPDEDGAFVTSDIWDADPAQLDFLDRVVTATLDERFVPPRGLPGEVAGSHLALWLPNLALAANYPRNTVIDGGSSWAFPVVTGIEVVAVMEFVHPVPRAADERMLQLAPSIGTQLGRAFEWQRLRERQDADRRRLEDVLAQRDDEIAALRRGVREAEDVRAVYAAFLAHEARSALGSARGPGQDDGLLAGVLETLVSVTDGTERRLLGERTRCAPDELVRDVARRWAGEGAHVVAVPEAPPAAAVSLHRPSLERILDELVGNAVRHSGSAEVELRAATGPAELTIEVRDRGRGYTWPGNVTRPSGGSGLAQAARLASALGGELTVAAADDGGTRATVRVAARAGGPAAWTVRSQRVLLVDDNEINRRLAAAMLGRIGLSADVVDGGASALEAMRGTAYGLVLMDVQMPDMDGREATRAWRLTTDGATAADVPIVAVTAHVGQAERDLCRDAGMVDYLSKPYGIDALADVARRWLDRHPGADLPPAGDQPPVAAST